MTQIVPYSFMYTQAALNAWGRWSLHRIGGYPTAWNMEIRIEDRGEPPEGVMAVDCVIASLAHNGERHLQRRLIVHYQRDCAMRELLARLGVGSRKYYDDLEEAQWAVHVRLTG